MPNARPDLSVVVPTYGRPECNWRRFAAKWSGSDDAHYGGYDFLVPLMAPHWPSAAATTRWSSGAGRSSSRRHAG